MTLTLMRNGTSGFHQTIDTFFNIFWAQDLKKSEMLAFVLLYYIYCEQACQNFPLSGEYVGTE